jgi:hypothetical protein
MACNFWKLRWITVTCPYFGGFATKLHGGRVFTTNGLCQKCQIGIDLWQFLHFTMIFVFFFQIWNHSPQIVLDHVYSFFLKIKTGLPKPTYYLCSFLDSQSTTQTLNTHAHSPLWIHVRKPYPYEHLRRTEHRQIWRFSKSQLAPNRRRERRLPLNA